MKARFKLIHGDSLQEYGTMSFNGSFVFELDSDVDVETWNKIGFIDLGEHKKVESNDLFWYLNSRLPIQLRNRTNQEKIDYIERTGLRVASDHFFLRKV